MDPGEPYWLITGSVCFCWGSGHFDHTNKSVALSKIPEPLTDHQKCGCEQSLSEDHHSPCSHHILGSLHVQVTVAAIATRWSCLYTHQMEQYTAAYRSHPNRGRLPRFLPIIFLWEQKHGAFYCRIGALLPYRAY